MFRFQMQCFDPPKHLFLYLPAALRYHVVRVYHSQCNQENRSHGGQFNEGSFIREASQIVRRGKIAQIKHKVAATITRAGGTIEGADVTRAQGLNSLLGAGNLECKVGAGSAEESMAAASAESLQTLIKIPPETKRERERKTYLGFSSPVSSLFLSLVEPQKNQFGGNLGNVVCRSHPSGACDTEQSTGKWGRRWI